MARTVPVYTYQAADSRSLRFAADSDFWITDMSGDDGLDIETKTSQSYGQTGKTITNQSVGERSITVTGAILRDLDANEALLKEATQVIRGVDARQKKRHFYLYGAVWACAGALLTGVVWLCTVLF